MPTTPLFPVPEGLELTSISDTPEELLVYVTSHRSSSPCPQCSMPSTAIHSSYHRHRRDLPCAGRPIRLLFTVRKFFCRTPNCSRKVFTERLPDFIEASSRLTKRLRTAVQEIGWQRRRTSGCQAWNGCFRCHRALVAVSDSSTMPVGQVHVVGVDDWSWRRGKRFGTILVNLQTHKIIDLLADREAESVQKWLAKHPEVEIVSRDRGGVYIDGATRGAPQATQVADRWHILSNLGDAVEEFLSGRSGKNWAWPAIPCVGMSDALQSHHCPHHVLCAPVSLIRMKTICSHDGVKVNATQPDSIAKSVNADIQAVQPWYGLISLTCVAPQGMVLLLGPARSAQRPSLQAFVKMVRERKHQDLRSWMEQATSSGIPELGSFVAGIERDYDAVHAALRLPWSQKAHKLKTLKRVMYGRASFALLWQQLLHDA